MAECPDLGVVGLSGRNEGSSEVIIEIGIVEHSLSTKNGCEAEVFWWEHGTAENVWYKEVPLAMASYAVGNRIDLFQVVLIEDRLEEVEPMRRGLEWRNRLRLSVIRRRRRTRRRCMLVGRVVGG